MTEIQVKERKLKAKKPITNEHRLECIKVSKNNIPGWNRIPNDDYITMKAITGGLTNVLTKVIIPQSLANQLGVVNKALIRHFGDTDAFFERSREELIFKSCALGKLSPGFIASFPGGRIEEYLAGSVTLNSNDCRLFINQIASKTAEVHNHQIEELPKEPSIFKTLTDWLKTASEVLPNTNKPSIQSFNKTINFNALKSEIEFLKKIIIPLNSPVVFCHNDLLSANFMYNKETKKFYVIDFEYANYNYRGYDIANHFAEWIVDYTRPDYPKFYLQTENYPTVAERELFIKYYLKRSKELKGQFLNIEDWEIAQIQKEIDYFLLLPHFAWSVWAMIQAATSTIDFGYVEFAQSRLKHYFDLKKDLITKHKL